MNLLYFSTKGKIELSTAELKLIRAVAIWYIHELETAAVEVGWPESIPFAECMHVWLEILATYNLHICHLPQIL